MVIAFVDDLLFKSKIRAVAQSVGATISFARGGDDIAGLLKAGAPQIILIDLEGRSGDAIDTIRAIRAAGASTRIVGFGSHVNVDRLQAAKEAGCDQALARSAFVQILPNLLLPSSAGAVE